MKEISTFKCRIFYLRFEFQGRGGGSSGGEGVVLLAPRIVRVARGSRSVRWWQEWWRTRHYSGGGGRSGGKARLNRLAQTGRWVIRARSSARRIVMMKLGLTAKGLPRARHYLMRMWSPSGRRRNVSPPAAFRASSLGAKETLTGLS